jgi:putative ABC transport system permease protein
MVKNFFILALRNLLKRKLYSFINIFGLAIGVAVCLVILVYVDFELSYDRYHKNVSQIYRAISSYYHNGELKGTGVMSGYALGPALAADVPEIKNYIRTHPMYGGAVVTYKRESGDPSIFREEKMQFADSTFMDVFTHKAIAGDLKTAMDNPKSVIITRKMADKYFGKQENALGKILQVSGGLADGDFEVTAVIEDIPQNSHFTFDFLFPVHDLLKGKQYQQDDGWGWQNFITYVALHPNTDIKTVDSKMAAFIEKYMGKELDASSRVVQEFQPITDIHLTPGIGLDPSPTTSTNTIYFFVIISIFILSIAWINYINLSTARAMERAREVGIKKAVGALKSQLMSQFIFESFLVNLLGVIIAVLIAVALLPVLGGIVGKELAFNFSDYRFWAFLATLFLIGSLISGAYPAFVLSSFNTTQVLKGKVENLSGGFSLRKFLVVFQFASSLILIAGTFGIYRQLIYMRSQDKGLTMEQMLIVNGPKVMEGKNSKERLITFKNEIKKIPGVISVTTSGAIPGGGYNWGTSMRREGAPEEETESGSVVWVDTDFVETYGIKVLAGRTFNLEIKSDMEAVLINEAALKTFRLGDAEHALQERIILGGDTAVILGVLKNFHWNSLKTDLTPWLFKADTISRQSFSILLGGSSMKPSIEKIEEKYRESFAGNPFDFYFLDDFFNDQYKDDQQFAKIFSLFAILAIVIACLGLWGLASFTTALKLKEIGIRKVLGASVSSIMSLLSWQFLKLVFVASLIAIPLTWYGIDTWLDTFAFRIGLQWDMFVVPVIILGVLALGTVSLQILKGANINPAKILRSE